MKKWLKDIPLGRVPAADLIAFVQMIASELERRHLSDSIGEPDGSSQS